MVQTGSGVHPTSYKMGTGGSYPGVKRQGREADHSPPTSAEVKKMCGSIHPLPHTSSWHNAQGQLYLFTFTLHRSRGSAVDIATGYGLDDRGFGVRVLVGARMFSSPSRPQRLWGPPEALSPRVKRPGRGADHSPPPSAEVKKMWIYTSTPPYSFRV
jgi:hypothetical protein